MLSDRVSARPPVSSPLLWFQALGLPPDYQCTQFPDMSTTRDAVIVGLICTAIALPYSLFVEELFSQANEPEFPEKQLAWPAWYNLVFGRRQRWHFAATKPGTLAVLMARFASQLGTVPLELALRFADWAEAKVTGKEQAARHNRGARSGAHHHGHEGPGGGAGKEGGGGGVAASRRLKRHVGLVVLYTGWAIQVWMIFVCACPLFPLFVPLCGFSRPVFPAVAYSAPDVAGDFMSDPTEVEPPRHCTLNNNRREAHLPPHGHPGRAGLRPRVARRARVGEPGRCAQQTHNTVCPSPRKVL